MVYQIYPETEQRLKDAGVPERFKRFRDDEDRPSLLGFASASDLQGFVEDMGERGFWKTLPETEGREFKRVLGDAFKGIYGYSGNKKQPWRVMRFTGESEIETDAEHVEILLGWPASLIFSPEELWDCRRYGFRSISAFTGAVGAYMKEASYENLDQGLVWETALPDGRVMSNDIGGNMHADLLIQQTDLTPYSTIDPLGNETGFRPECGDDWGTVAALHSVEGHFLSIILRYLHHSGVRPGILDDGGRGLLDWARSLGQRGGNTAEHLYGGTTTEPMLYFGCFDVPMSRTDDNGRLEGRPRDFIPGDINYAVHIGPGKELVISRITDGVEKPCVTYLPEEMDNVLKGLFYQAAKGLGRTSARHLIDILGYRFSTDFERDQAAIKNL